MWKVVIKNKVDKELCKLPVSVRGKAVSLIADLMDDGPVQPRWRNYSKLSDREYHCHLTYHYVACWKVLSETELEMEVYYVGSRESAPY